MSNRKEVTGSRPPPQKRPSTSSLSIVFVMSLVVVGAFVASGSLVPVDPNGPGGPPTLAPYYNPADYPVQNIITPTGGFATNKQNLQLQTFGVDNCGENSVMLFLIDTSGSMSYYDKIGHEKQALSYFTSNMGGLSAIGIDTFGGPPGDVSTLLPLSYYKDVKPQVTQVINGLTANGATPTRDAMQLAYNQLQQSISEEQYPNYQYNLILLTDGVPEQLPPRTCEEQTTDPLDAPLPRCFALQEDPTLPTDISAEIRSLGVDIYTINVYSPQRASDVFMLPYLSLLLEKVASEPTSTHYYVSVDGTNLSDVLQSINQSICQDELDGPAPSQ
jgi:hypothetical protein